jgi:hypothetical protein
LAHPRDEIARMPAMIENKKLATALLAAASLTTLVGSAPSRAAAATPTPPACTAKQLAGTTTPIRVRQDGITVTRLEPGKTYDVDKLTDVSDSNDVVLVDGSVTAVAQPGTTLTPRSGGYRFKAPAKGPFVIAAFWQLRDQDTGAVCSAAAKVSTPVVARALATVGKARFVKLDRALDASIFSLPIRTSVFNDLRPLTVEFRFHAGSLTIPSVRSRASRRFVYSVNAASGEIHTNQYPHARFDPYVTIAVNQDFADGFQNTNGRLQFFEIETSRAEPLGKRFAYAFSVRILQGSTVVGGMRGGASCVRVQRPGASVTQCTPHGFASRP